MVDVCHRFVAAGDFGNSKADARVIGGFLWQESVRTIFSFGVDGTKLVGTVSGPQGISPISEGKIDGSEISFIIARTINGNTQKLVFRGKVRGEEIEFVSKLENGQKQQEFTAKRESQENEGRPSRRFITLP